tara:strand:- start:323 stop:502 length:180 start_codon:yes stop_codon:yes gene_type:complete
MVLIKHQNNDMINIKLIVKKILGEWKVIKPNTITENDLDNLILVTTSGRKYKLKEILKK